jgi:hypothetical protein
LTGYKVMDGLLTEFDEGLWNATVESATVQADGGMRFWLRDGDSKPVQIQYGNKMFWL